MAGTSPAMTALLVGLVVNPAFAADPLRLAIQPTGTFGWELAVAKSHGLDKAGLDIQTDELATTEAGKIALVGGGADIILSDWLWVARERGLGNDMQFYPLFHRARRGDGQGPATPSKPSDLIGKKLGVAGGPLDKSWLMLQAWALAAGRRSEISGRHRFRRAAAAGRKTRPGRTRRRARILDFCRPPPIHGLFARRGHGGGREGARRQGAGDVTGYVFSAAFAKTHGPALKRFFAMLGKAHDALASDPAAWAPVRARLHATDAATFAAYRRRYLEGAPKRPVADEAADARALFKAIAGVGGAELTGGAKDLDPAAFYDPSR